MVGRRGVMDKSYDLFLHGAKGRRFESQPPLSFFVEGTASSLSLMTTAVQTEMKELSARQDGRREDARHPSQERKESIANRPRIHNIENITCEQA